MQFSLIILSFPIRHVELPNSDERNGTNAKDSTGLGWTVLTRVACLPRDYLRPAGGGRTT